MKIKQWQLLILFGGFLYFIPSAWSAERVEILSPNPVGSGARAMGMGGAFIAITDDATAASWNPGGLIQLEKPEISAVFGYVRRTEDNTFGEPTLIDASGEQSIHNGDINYLSAAYPFALGEKKRNMIISLNYQYLYDFNRNWNSENDTYKYTQKGALYALGIAYCAQITIDFSIGFTLNYWGDFLFKNKWEQAYHYEKTIKDQNSISIWDQKNEFSFNGWNMNVGFLWKIGEHFTIGGILKTPFTASVRQKTTTISKYIDMIDSANSHNPDPIPKEDDNNIPKEDDNKLYMPLAYGVGMAYRFSDSFTIAADVYKTHWNDFKLEDSKGNTFSPISINDSEVSDIDPTIWFRLGAEYLFIGEKIVVPIRAGIFYDPAPAGGSPDDYYGFSLGSGLNYDRFSFDIAYQFRFGNNVGASMLQNLGFSQDVYEHTIYSSLIFYF